MKVSGKTITLYLLDEDAEGRWKGRLKNWNGTAYKIPREKLGSSGHLEHIKNRGVYFLFWHGNAKSKPSVYVGETNTILQRLVQHCRDSYADWEEAIAFISTDNGLSTDDIMNLETRFLKLASRAERYNVKNGTAPKVKDLPESEEHDLKIFIDNASLLLLVLGHPVFTPLRPQTSGQVKNTLSKKKDKTDVTASKKERPASSAVSKKSTPAPAQGQNSDEEIIFRFKSKKVVATGRLSGNGFIVFKGSAIRPNERPSCEEHIKKKRRKLIETGRIKDNVFVEDTFFETPSGAAGTVNGGNENGYRMWITPDGRLLRDFRKNT